MRRPSKSPNQTLNLIDDVDEVQRAGSVSDRSSRQQVGERLARMRFITRTGRPSGSVPMW